MRKFPIHAPGFRRLIFVPVALAAAVTAGAGIALGAPLSSPLTIAGVSASGALRELSQAEAPDDEAPIPTDQVDKYIAVYSAMQRDHGLSVEQAASKQGLTVSRFREIEDKIERNPVVHERVLEALRNAGKKQQPTAKATPKTE